jgi:hypothetical protein
MFTGGNSGGADEIVTDRALTRSVYMETNSRDTTTRTTVLVALLCAAFAGTAQAAGPPEAPPPQDRIAAVSVTPQTLGALAISVKSTPARTGTAEGGDFAVYRLTYTNRGRKTFRFINERTSAFFGAEDGLLLADDGCGFAFEKGKPVEDGVCQAYLDVIKLKPGESTKRTITAWTGLRGMGELEAGDFTLDRPVEITRRGKVKREGTLGFTFSVSD